LIKHCDVTLNLRETGCGAQANNSAMEDKPKSRGGTGAVHPGVVGLEDPGLQAASA